MGEGVKGRKGKGVGRREGKEREVARVWGEEKEGIRVRRLKLGNRREGKTGGEIRRGGEERR